MPGLLKSLEARLGRAFSTTEARDYINSETTSLYARMKEYGKNQVFSNLEDGFRGKRQAEESVGARARVESC
jgi:hypothetical protein